MLISQLYVESFFREGRNTPEFDAYVLQQFERNAEVIQAQQFSPLGISVGGGKMGMTFEEVASEGGLSPNRSFYNDVTPNVVAGTPKTVYMGNNAEKVVIDKRQMQIMGNRERDRQLNAALARLRKTFVHKLMLADTTKVDATDVLNNPATTKKYDFDGYEVYFATHEGQVEANILYIGDIVKDVQMKYEANAFLNSVKSMVDVVGMGPDVIYTSKKGKTILGNLEANKYDYTGEYKFGHKVQTWEGIPIIEIPDAQIPAAWKAKGEFVMFVNQNEDAGCRIMVPTNGGLIVTHPDVPTAYTIETPMDMTFALVSTNGKAASLCFLNGGATAPTVDKTALMGTIITSQQLVEADYTAPTWATFEAALTAAITCLNDADATQTEVIAATATLQAAVEGLVAA